jgi:glycosyltransferase involved in cell wall biosynthesis
VHHSRELIRALHDGNLLGKFITSVDGTRDVPAWLPLKFRERFQSRITQALPDDMVLSMPYVEMGERLVGRFCWRSAKERVHYASLDLFDRIASSRVLACNPRIVVGFENSCRHTFRKAKEGGAFCVLDAPSVHHTAQHGDHSGGAVFRKNANRRKDEEISLADHLVVLSTYAKETYVSAGVPAGKITIVPPGVRAPDIPVERPRLPASSGVGFLFVGNVSLAKGVDLLLEAFARLHSPGKRLAIAGGLAGAGVLPRTLPNGVEFLGKLTHKGVFAAHRQAEVLVLPSRFDGFGFVVAEAMASGLPVIVSTTVGARDIVVDGVTGWIFKSGSAHELQSTMERAAADRQALRKMGARARESVAALTWETYGRNIRRLYENLLSRLGSR